MGQRVENQALPRDVLIVEDEMLIAFDLSDTLKRLGVRRTAIANSTAEARQLMAKRAPDLVLLDYHLTGETGDAIAEDLRQQNIPFVFATGDPVMKTLMKEKGACDLLQKPYEEAAILRALTACGAARAAG